jgi:hypothetical protein
MFLDNPGISVSSHRTGRMYGGLFPVERVPAQPVARDLSTSYGVLSGGQQNAIMRLVAVYVV